MRETGESISQWAEETFGPPVSLARIASRALKEMSELMDKVTHPEPDPKAIAAECADVVIVLARLAHRCGGDIFEITYTEFPKHTWISLIGKAQASLATIVDALLEFDADTDPRWISKHCRSIQADLNWACYQFRHDLRAEVDAKMAINRARKWVLDGTGHGQHVVRKPSIMDVAVGAKAAALLGEVGK